MSALACWQQLSQGALVRKADFSAMWLAYHRRRTSISGELSHSTTVILYKNDCYFWRYATLRRNPTSHKWTNTSFDNVAAVGNEK